MLGRGGVIAGRPEVESTSSVSHYNLTGAMITNELATDSLQGFLLVNIRSPTFVFGCSIEHNVETS